MNSSRELTYGRGKIRKITGSEVKATIHFPNGPVTSNYVQIKLLFLSIKPCKTFWEWSDGKSPKIHPVTSGLQIKCCRLQAHFLIMDTCAIPALWESRWAYNVTSKSKPQDRTIFILLFWSFLWSSFTYKNSLMKFMSALNVAIQSTWVIPIDYLRVKTFVFELCNNKKSHI